MTHTAAPMEEVDPRAVELKGRLFNTLKMRERLLTADAMLRPIAQFWILTGVLMGAPLALDPMKYPVYLGFIYSAVCFCVYYGLIGAVRRSTETYLEKLAATYGYDLTKGSVRKLQRELDADKPFKDTDDPPLVRTLFGIAKFLHLPRRGLIQQTVVLAQFVFLAYYVFNYLYYWGKSTPVNFPEVLWQLHGAVTLFGVIMMVKNSAFLLNNKFFLALVKGVFDWRASAGRVASEYGENSSPPDKQCETEKSKK